MASNQLTTIYLLHGRGGWPGGSVLLLEELLRKSYPGVRYVRPSLPHGRENGVQPAERSLEYLRALPIERAALVIGVSLGGLVAARLQEDGREDLQVICISSPTWADGVAVERNVPHRLSLYSSQDEVIAGRTSLWPRLAEAHDLPWLTHDTDAHKAPLVQLIVEHMSGSDLAGGIGFLRDFPGLPRTIP
jgi:pimeloyl-ACP methyl ester carboxylesterase